jgi:hypothetical protein
MGRKVSVNLSDTINSFRVKTNAIAAQIGDLDDLTTGGSVAGDNGFTGKDSDVVEALNHVYNLAFIDSNQIKEHHIDTHAVSGRNIDSDVITSHHLAVTGLGSYNTLAGGISYQFLRSDGDGTFTWAIPPTTNYQAGDGISKTTVDDSSGVFNVAGGHGLTQEAGGLKLEDMPANTVKVRDANTAGASSNKAVTNQQILIGNGTGFTSAALSQDVLMTNAGVVTIQADVVTNAKLNNMAANTVKVNATADAENPTDLSISTNTVLGRVAGNVVAAQVATGQIADDAVTYAKIQNVATADRVLGSTTADGIVAEVQVKGDMLKDKVTLIIYNSAGAAVKTLHGAGS